MNSNVLSELQRIRVRLQRWATLSALAWCAVALLAGLLLVGTLDAWWRPTGQFTRYLLSAVAIGPCLVVMVRILWPVWKQQPSDLHLARRIEQKEPRWQGRLSAAVDFFQAPPHGSSRLLEDQTVSDVERELARRPLPDLIDSRRVRWPFVWNALAVMIVIGAFLSQPAIAWTAITRIAQPGRAIDWPRHVVLELVDAQGRELPGSVRMAQGEPFRFFVRNVHGDVPADVTLEIQDAVGQIRREPIPTGVDEQIQPSTVIGIGQLFSMVSPMRFRVTGGDDREMSFRDVELVVPPTIEQISVVVTPPGYLRMSPIELPPGTGRVSAVVGSEIDATIRTSAPLSRAQLLIADRLGPAPELSADRRILKARFTLGNVGVSSYWFRLRDENGIESTEALRFELRGQADLPPTVTLAKPAGDLFATANAALPLEVEATDDYGMTALRFRWQRNQPLSDRAVGVNSPSEAERAAVTPADQMNGILELPLAVELAKQSSATEEWLLEPLQLKVGDRLFCRAEATDAYDLEPPHLGVSGVRTITIVTAEEKQAELVQRQKQLLIDLVEAERNQSRLTTAVEALASGSEPHFTPEALDELTRTEIEFKALADRIADPNLGAAADAKQLVEEAQQNGLADEPSLAPLQEIQRTTAELAESLLQSIDRDLTQALKAAASDAETARLQLKSAHHHLELANSTLGRLIEQLGGWQNHQQLLSDLEDLIRDQNAVRSDTAAAGQQTFGRPAGQLTPQQRTLLDQLSIRQRSLGEQYDRLLRQLENLSDANPAESPAEGDEGQGDATSLPERLAAAARIVREGAVAARARAAGESIQRNEIGEAGRQQQELQNQLQAVRNRLGAEPGTENPRSVESLEAAVNRFADLVERQQTLAEELKSAAAENPEKAFEQLRSAIDRQAELRESALALEKMLKESQGREFAEVMQAAATAMMDAINRMTRNDADTAADRAEAAAASLSQARQLAEQSIQTARQQQASGQLSTLATTIQQLLDRQRAVLGEVDRLEDLRKQTGRHPRSSLVTLREVAETQRVLKAETGEVAGEIAESGIVTFGLQSAAELMAKFAGELDQRETSPAAAAFGERTAERLEQVAAAINQAAAARQPGEQKQPPAANDSADARGGSPVPPLAELKLLRALQADLRDRTVAMNAEGNSPQSRQRLAELADEQQRLKQLYEALRARVTKESATR